MSRLRKEQKNKSDGLSGAPVMTKEKQIFQPNPAYLEAETELRKVNDELAGLEAARYSIQAKINAVFSNQDSLNWAGTAAIGGALTELMKDRNEQRLESALVKALVCGLVGYGSNELIKQTFPQAEQKRIDRLARLNIELDELKRQIDFAHFHRAEKEERVKRTPKKIAVTIEETVRDPGKQRNSAPSKPKPQKLDDMRTLAAAPALVAEKGKETATAKYETAAEVLRKNTPKYPFEGIWAEVIGKPETRFYIMFWGKPGSGKSTSVLHLAKYLADSFTPGNTSVLYVSSEESNAHHGASQTMRDKLERAGVTAGTRIKIGAYSNFDELNEQAKKHPFVVLDSVTDMGVTPEQVKQLNDSCSLICIHQATKDKEGQFKGDNRFLHDAQTEVVLKDFGCAEVKKNRYAGNSGQTYRLFDR
jgi:hypothetical protein